MRSSERQKTFPTQSPPIPKLGVVNAAKCFSQTWEYLDKRTINESAVIKILELLFSARMPC